MSYPNLRRRSVLAFLGVLVAIRAATGTHLASAQDPASAPGPLQITAPAPPAPLSPPSPAVGDRPMCVNLPTALQLANARPIDIALASERVQAAAAELQRTRVLWLPTVYLGADYFRHDGQIQDVAGNIVGTSKSSVMVGGGDAGGRR